MEQPRTHGQKKNTKTVPATINIVAGIGSFGIGGIVLLGGALVTATIVSVLAFKRSKRRQSSSENINDFSADFSPLENPSDGVTSMMETETKTSQNLSKDAKHDSGIGNFEKVESEDSNEDLMFAIGQENTSVHVDSDFENREVETSYEKLLECEERVVMETQIEYNSCLEKEDGGEEKKYLTIINNGNDEIADEKSLVSDESVTSIEEYEAIEGVEAEEGVVRDITTESSQDHIPSGNSHETVLMNEETACVNLVEVHDHHYEQKNEEEKDLSDETCYADQIVYEVAIEEKTIDADCVRQTEVQNGPLVPLLDCEDAIIMQNCVGDLSKQCSSEQVIGQKETVKEDCVDIVDMEDMLEMDDHKVALDVQEKQVSKDRETFAITRITNSLKGAIDDQTIVKEDKSPAQSVMEETKEDLTAVQVEAETITEYELVKKEGISKEDEIPHVISVEEDAEVRSNKSSDELEESSVTTEPKISNHNNEDYMEENLTILGRLQNDSDQNGIIKDDKGSTSSSKILIELAKAKKQVLASEPWNIKLMTWSLLVSIWCLCHWYSELPYPELSLVGSLFFVLILLGYRNRTTYLV